MIRRALLLILSFISISSCKAQTTDKKKVTMEVYAKKIHTLEVKMFIDTNVKEQKTSWGIYVFNSKDDSVLLDQIEHPGFYDKEQENLLTGDIRKRVIIGDVFLYNRTIYLILYNFGKIYFKTYEFIEVKKFIKYEYFAEQLITGSYMNFGDPKYSAEIIRISDDEFLIDGAGGTELSSGFLPLLKFNHLTKKLTRIIFNEDSTKKIKSNDTLFETMDLYQNTEKVTIEIKKVLIENNYLKTDDNFKYLGSIDRSHFRYTGNRINTGTIYFFYQINKNISIQLIRYDNSENEWLIGNYTEEQMEPDK